MVIQNIPSQGSVCEKSLLCEVPNLAALAAASYPHFLQVLVSNTNPVSFVFPASDASMFSKKSSPNKPPISTDQDATEVSSQTHAQGSGVVVPELVVPEFVAIGDVLLPAVGFVGFAIAAAAQPKSGAIGFPASISERALALAFFVPLYSFFHLNNTPLIRLIS